MRMKPIPVVIATVALALPLAAQMFGPRVPTLSGVWHPVVGSGAAYERSTTGENEKMQLEITVVGKDDMEGKSGIWMEYAITDAKMPGGQVLMKQLMTVSENSVVSSKMIFQQPGQQPMELDMNMANRMSGGNASQIMVAGTHSKTSDQRPAATVAMRCHFDPNTHASVTSQKKAGDR